MLAAIFAGYGGYETQESYVDGLVPAVWVGAVVVAIGALAALLIPRARRAHVSVGPAFAGADSEPSA